MAMRVRLGWSWARRGPGAGASSAYTYGHCLSACRRSLRAARHALSTGNIAVTAQYADIDLGRERQTPGSDAARRYQDSNGVFVVSGASRGIGLTIADHLLQRTAGTVICLGRSCTSSAGVSELAARHNQRGAADRMIPIDMDLGDPESVDAVASAVHKAGNGRVDLLFNVAGLLGNGKADPGPERTVRKMDPSWIRRSFDVNVFGHVQLVGALYENGCLRVGRKNIDRPPAVVASLTARVGSIGDNRLGGWYSYRMSKAAMNQFTKTFSLEAARDNCFAVSLHPGTVDTALSEPFQRGVPAGKLFTKDFCAARMLAIVDAVDKDRTGGFFDWDGKAVPW